MDTLTPQEREDLDRSEYEAWEPEGDPILGVEVQLTGEDGGVMSIMNRVNRAMKSVGASRWLQDKFREEALSGNYDHVLRTCMKFVEVT